MRSLLAAMLLAVPTLATAQATVAGTVTLDERKGIEHGDLRAAVVYLQPHGETAPAATYAALRSSSIAMRGREFQPHVRVVIAGGTVSFPNEDPFSHNVFSNTDLGPFDLGLYPRGESRTATFAHPGVYPIYCNIHSKMVSFVVAVPSPWVAQPDAEGRFAIHGVPPGTYVLHAWHERGTSEVVREIEVPAAGSPAPLQLTIDARAYVEAPHLNKFGRPYLILRADRY